MATRFQNKRNVWVVSYKDVDGKWKQKSCGKNATAQDAESIRKLYDARELNYRHGGIVKVVPISIHDAIKEFKEQEVPRSRIGRPKAKGTIKGYNSIANSMSKWMVSRGINDFKDATESAMTEYFDRLLQGVAPKAIATHRMVITQFFRWAMKKGYCYANPVTIKTPQKIARLPRYFTDEELNVIFENAKEPYKAIFKFLYLTGLRIGELSNLKWADVDETQRQITIRIMDGNKTKRECAVDLNNDALAILQQRRGETESPYVFSSIRGKRVEQHYVAIALKKILQNANITNASLHTFRHTCASHLAINGISLYVIKEILRHKSIKETEIYAHLSREATTAAIQTLRI